MPLYHQIFLQLRDEIISGLLPHGTVLPTEQSLSLQFGVSRITAQRVLDELARQGFVERKRRVGTTVIFHSPVKSIEANIDQAIDSLLAIGQGAQARVLEVAVVTVPNAVTDALGLEPGTEVVRARRIRLLDGVPLGYVQSYAAGHFASVLTPEALAVTPVLKLLEAAGYRPSKGEQTIGAMLADVTVTEALEIEPRSAVLRIIRTIYDSAGKPLLLTFAHYRSDRFHVRLDLSLPDGLASASPQP
jgi:GntR family transcriptional regulator